MASGTVWLRLGWVVALLAGSGALAEEPAPPPAPPAEERSSVQWQLMAGGVAVADGYSSLGHQGLLLASGWEYPSLRLRFQFMFGLPTWFRQDPRFEVRMEQYTMGLWLDTPLLRTERLRWGAGLGAGLLVFARSAYSRAGGVDASRPRFIPTLLVGPDTSVRWRLSRLFSAEASLGLEAVAGRPLLGYAENEAFQTLERGWTVRPRLGVTMMLHP